MTDQELSLCLFLTSMLFQQIYCLGKVINERIQDNKLKIFKRVYRNTCNRCILRVYYPQSKFHVKYIDYDEHDVDNNGSWKNLNNDNLLNNDNNRVLIENEKTMDLTLENVGNNRELYELYSCYNPVTK